MSSTNSAWSWAKRNLIWVKLLLLVQGEDYMCSYLPAAFLYCVLQRSSQGSFCTEVQNSCQNSPLHRPICHSGIMDLLRIVLGQQLHQTLRIWNGGHLEIWIMFHCAAENLYSSFKGCEDLREVAWLKSISSLERRNIQVPWSRFGVNWCQIWYCEIKAAIPVLPRHESTFWSLHAYWFTELFCMSICAVESLFKYH